MKFKKIMSVLTAVTCCSCMFAYLPSFVQKTYASEIVHNDFEVTYEGWHGTDYDIEVTASDSIGYQNSRGMLVSGRKTAQDGAEASKGLYLVGDVDYNYSIQVFSRTDETFHISLTCDDMDTQESTTTELVSQNVNANEWTELKASYKAPKNSCEFRITITTDTTNDFIFDELNITTKQTEKANAVFAATSEKGLKDEFADYFRVGNILNAGWGNGGTVANSAITANIIKDCNSIECENETKADSVLVKSQCNGTNIGVSLNAASTIIDFCIKNNIGFRGHAFVWHSQTPAWFLKENFNENGNWVSADVMNQRLESYMKNLFALYEKQYPTLDLYAYDICNECVSDNSNRTANNGGAREPGDNNTEGGKSAYVAVYGDNSFVEKAFTYARKYAPSTCKLYYNDYNEYWDHKRDCIYNMCKSLYEKGVLDGVGMQSHIPANATGFAGTDSYIEAMKKYLSIGCDVQITELDISLENGKYTAQEQADKYKAIFQAAMDWNKNPQSSGKVTLIAIWGPNDANSWLKEGSDALLYDKNNQPKLAYTTLTSMIPKSEWGDGSNYSDSDDKPVEPNEWGWYFSDGFEGDTCSWEARGGDVTIMTSGRTAFVGNEALLVQGRTSSWNGASKSLNPKAFVPGNEYSFSANVNYFDGDETDKFYLKLQYTDSEGETQYSTIAEATAIKGEWVQIANKNYKIPADASNMQIYIETAETTNNFYIDEVIGAVGGTTIIGAEPSTKPSDSVKALAGDANLDGIVDIADAVAVASYVGDSKLNALESQGLINADVQGDGNGVNANDALMIQQYLAGIISELSIPNSSGQTSEIDVSKMETLFSGIKLADSYKKDNENNPLYTQRFGADPGVMEYNGRVYVYMTNDVIEYDSNGNVTENTYGQVNKINCISSDDMINWTDHGVIEAAGANGVAKWASLSWAPCAAHKTINGKEKFFLYFCNGGNGICVLTADSPTGPWSDPLGKALVTRQVSNCSDIPWLFDPAVMVDDDGTGYLCFGGGVPEGKQAMPSTSRIVKLGDDMISLAGTPSTINAPYIFEDSGINKIGNKYYYTYCSNWNTSGNNYGLTSGAIEYMVSDNPLGPYTYGGELFKNQGTFFGYYGNNHHSIVELNNQLYLFYHSRSVEGAMGIEGNYRSPQVDKITMNNDKISSVTGTMQGIAQLKSLNPYEKIQAETMSSQSNNISVNGCGNTTVSGIKGSWIKASGIDFTKGANKLTVCASSKNGAVIKVCTGSKDGKAITYVEIPSGQKTSEIEVPVINSVSGVNDLYFVFSNDLDFDYWYFS